MISDQIKELDLSFKDKAVTCLGKTCQNQLSDTSSKEEDKDAEITSSEDIINTLQETFEDDSPLAINKIRNWTQGTTRNYYPWPTAPDIQYEERGSFTTSHFSGDSVYQWNIDGKSEHEILSTL